MKVIFAYDRERDISCLLTYGKTSFNSQTKTKAYERLIEKCGEEPTREAASEFIDMHMSDKCINVPEYISNCQKDWYLIADEYQKRARAIFKVDLPDDITACLTVNDRCPYDIENKYFFISFSPGSFRGTIMHELWHFYTWHKFGITDEVKLGKQKYNDLKEALTVLLNIECKDLFSDGPLDSGYPQHKELRERILRLWEQSRDIDELWEELAI